MVVNTKPATNEIIDTAICHTGTLPEGMRAIITIGEENGIILPHTEIGASGLPAAVVIITNDKMMGIVIGSINA